MPPFTLIIDIMTTPEGVLKTVRSHLTIYFRYIITAVILYLFFYMASSPRSLFDQYSERALLIEGVAGSGKTTLIAQEAEQCVPQGRTLLVTFSRAGRDVLQQYMQSRNLEPVANSNLHIFTIDGLAHFLLRRLGDERYVLDRKAIVTDLLPELVTEVCDGLQNEWDDEEDQGLQAPDLSEDAMEKLMSDLDYYRASLAWQAELPEEEQAAFGDGLHHPPALVRAVFRPYDTLRAHWKPDAAEPDDSLLDPAYSSGRSQGMYGFRLVSEAGYDLLEALDNGAQLPAGASAYQYVMIDEFHDTTPLQLLLLSRIARPAQRVMAVGDRYQTIFAWRGANTDLVFDTFLNDFSARRVNSLTSYRFGAELAKMAGELTHRNITSGISSDTPLAHCVGDWNDAGALAPLGKQTIICRHGADRIRAAFSLICHAPASIKVTWQAGTTPAVGVATLLYALRFTATTATLRTLALNVQQFFSLPGCLSPELARDLAQTRVTPASLRMYMDTWLGASAPVFTSSLKHALQEWLATPVAPETPAIEALQGFARRADLFRNPTAPQRLLDESFRQGWEGLMMYLQKHPGAIQDWPAIMTALSARCASRGGLRLLTVTEAKGHEYEHVLVYDAADTTFRNQTDAPDVERNRFYVACTRARKSLTLFRPA